MEEKKKNINKIKINEKDVGSTAVQIAVLSYDISIITEHLNKFKKDLHSKIGLIKKVNQRKKLLRYLKNKDKNKYFFVIKELNIRK